MILFKEAAALKKHLEKLKQAGKTIGFVPTMGALHDGHISLIKASKKQCDFTVCSIFVNPTQFNDPEDFKKYPVTISNDLFVLEANQLDIIFLPTVQEMYPDGLNAAKHYELGEVEHLLEGKYRPGHFQGVCQVVHKLLDIVHPHFLYLGQKDYQQCMVIKQLVKLIELPVNVVTVNTLRDASGLAMSSRNTRLDNRQIEQATSISKMLDHIKKNYKRVPLDVLVSDVRNHLLENGFNKVDYVSIADTETLQPKDDSTKLNKSVALIAATIGQVRLIDNLLLTD